MTAKVKEQIVESVDLIIQMRYWQHKQACLHEEEFKDSQQRLQACLEDQLLL